MFFNRKKGFIVIYPHNKIQLTLEQCGFELNTSTVMWIFFFYKCIGNFFGDVLQLKKS